MYKKIILFLGALLFGGSVWFYKAYDPQEKLQSPQKPEEAIFYRGNTAEPGTLDPHIISGTWEQDIVYDMFEGLVIPGKDGQAVPGLAKSWTISEDGLTYIFSIRDTAKWSNGEPVTAHDFVYSFRRALDPKTASYFTYVLYPIVYAEAINSGAEKDLRKLGVKALDEKTLEIKLSQPVLYFIEDLNQSVAYAVPQKIIEKYGNDWVKAENIVTNGAYTLDVWRPQENVELKRNPYYWDSHNVNIDRVLFYAIDDHEDAFRRFRSGELDFINNIPTDKISWLKETMPDEFHMVPIYSNYYYSFNLERRPFQDIRIRKALSITIEREKIAQNIVQYGFYPLYAFCSPGMINYTLQEANYCGIPQDLLDQEAKELMIEAGYGPENPLTFQLSYNASESHEKIAVSIAQMWKEKLGVNVELKNAEAIIHYSNLEEHNFDVGRAAFGVSFGDAYKYLKYFTTNNANNFGQYSNAHVDMLLSKAKNIVNMEMRRQILEKVERIIIDDYAIIPLFNFSEKFLVSTKIKGFTPNYASIFLTKYLQKSSSDTQDSEE